MSLEVRIKKSFGDYTLDVAFAAGDETLGFLGASGCGKSLTLRCIAGIETPDEGRIVVNGKVFFDSEQKINLTPQQRKTALLFQNYMLFPNLTVAQNVAAGIAKEPPPPYTAQCAERLGVPGGRAPVITSPKAGAAIYSPVGFDAARVLLAAGADPDAAILYWYADGAFLGARRVGKALEWSAPAGTHELAVADDLGRTSTMRLTIRRR